MGALLDRLSPGWQRRIFAPDTSLTSLLWEALKPSPAELESALKQERSKLGYAELVREKTKLADDGMARAGAVVKEIETGLGVGVTVDYSQLVSPRLGLGYTPFGITVVDAERTIFAQVPIKVTFGGQGEVAQTIATPLLRDTGRKLVRFRLPGATTRSEVEKALDRVPVNASPVVDLALELPGATIKASMAKVQWSGDELTIVLLEDEKKRQN